MNNIKNAIGMLIAVNVIFFIITYFMKDQMIQSLALYFPRNEHFGVWQYVTSMFMHGSITHILFNMYALWAFGSPLLDRWGTNKFVFFYFSSGIGAGLIYTLVNYYQFNSIYQQLVELGVSAADIQEALYTGTLNLVSGGFTEDEFIKFYQLYHVPALGASGAIYGILVAFGIQYPNAKLALIFLPVPIPAKFFIPALIALDLFSGITGFSIFGGGIAHFAHIGGAIIGFLLMWYWRKRE